MINFKEELKKYEPVLTIKEVEDVVKTDEIIDLIDVLKEIMSKEKDK